MHGARLVAEETPRGMLPPFIAVAARENQHLLDAQMPVSRIAMPRLHSDQHRGIGRGVLAPHDCGGTQRENANAGYAGLLPGDSARVDFKLEVLDQHLHSLAASTWNCAERNCYPAAMQKRLDSRSLELWTERLVAAESRTARENVLCDAAGQIDGLHAIQVWRELNIAGELKLTPTTLRGAHEALPDAVQVRAVVTGDLPAAGLSRVRLLGATLAAEAPVLALACDEVAEEALDGLDALLTLTLILEQDSQETALDSIRGLLDGLEGEPDSPH